MTDQTLDTQTAPSSQEEPQTISVTGEQDESCVSVPEDAVEIVEEDSGDAIAEDADDASADEAKTSENEIVEESAAQPEAQPADKTDWKDAYVRLAADFDNYRKRTAKEFDDVRKRERERVITSWLDVYDNTERAIAALPNKEGPWYEGFRSILSQMDCCLAAFDIVPVDDNGATFDPKKHEAIAILPNPALPNNTIMHVERRGFAYKNGDVARIARVVVVKNPS